ncbi:MAG: N-acetylmuramoyl-L-alanine amidase [Lachnospiraceae bacterium]|nr:N-acetylmuramoyl-L-alanine amidase [Lachnospiraceae bacterium]
MEKKKIELLMSVVLILCACILAGKGWEQASSSQVEAGPKKWTVVLDAGHGGGDPGKIGVDDSLEKDLNLIIAKKVQKLLEQQDVEVVMTRETDAGLYEEQTSNKKVQDMKNRCVLINETQPDCVVSIHQNSYHEEYVTGAQVFYYGTSEEGERLARTLQEKLIAYVDPENHREAKANESYYLLKKTEVPIVIVECGFLSNWEEAKKLQEDSYQNQIAWAVSMGILSYLGEENQ